MAILIAVFSARAGSLPFNTLAGYAGQGSGDGGGSNAQFNNPQSVAVDAIGNIYVADNANDTIRKITPAGHVITLAGAVGVNGSTDSANGSALFSSPQGVAVDAALNVYVADTGNNTIRKITPTGVVSTLAGMAGVSGSTDNTGTNASFYGPEGVAVDTNGNVYVADTWNHTIREITPQGAVSTLAGMAGNFGSANGSGGGAQFYEPSGVAVDASLNVYVADTGNNAIREISSSGAVSTLAGSVTNFGSLNATGTNALFYQPRGVAVDVNGNVYVADFFNNTIRMITSGGVVSTLAGTAGASGATDGINARFRSPTATAVNSAGTVYVADSGNGTVRAITQAGAVSTLAGSASAGSANGAYGATRFSLPCGIAVDTASNIYVADAVNATIRKITPSGVARTLTGLAGSFGSADGAGTNAQFYGPQGIAVDTAGNVYVADTGNATVRMITPSGGVSTLAGTAGSFGSLDGTGATAQFYGPQGIAVDGSGNIFVADTWNHTIRKIAGGVVSTIAGVAGSFGSADGAGTNARFNWPAGLAVDKSDNLYVADFGNDTIREITPIGTNWVTTTLAGLAGVWGSADGTNNGARFYQPRGIAVDGAGNVYVADAGNNTLRMLSMIGTNWVVSTLSGTPGVSGSIDGSGTQFSYPTGVALDPAGYLYVADSANNTLRVDRMVPPSLQYSFPGGQLVLTWPMSAAGFVLQAAGAPNSAAWTAVASGIGVSGNNFILTNSVPGEEFFRLQHP